MRVRGSKKRVHLTEVDLEPVEQKSVLRVAPAAASMVWLGSIALATAIYMEWLPARALFSDPRGVRSERPHSGRASRAHASTRARAAPPSAPPATSPDVPVTRPEPPAVTSEAGGPSPRESTVSTPSVVPESSRTIRGSYYSDDSNWAGGW